MNCLCDYDSKLFLYIKCWRQKYTPGFLLNNQSYATSKDPMCKATCIECRQATAAQPASLLYTQQHLAS